MKLFLLLLTAFSLNTCNTTNGEAPTPPRPTPIVTDTSLCSSAEQHLQQMCDADKSANNYCCLVVAPTKKGKSYAQFCQDKQNEGVFLNPKCVSTVTSCDQIDACTNSK